MKIRHSALLFLVAATALGDDGGMTRTERSYLLSQLESSKAAVLASIHGLSQAQWTFKPVPEAWSVRECAEHIILAEEFMFADEQKILAMPATSRLANATGDGDRQIVAQMEDRGSKAQAPPPIMPAGKFPTPESAAREFTLRRDKTIAYVKATKDALRAHSGTGPTGSTADAYQVLLMLASHSERHTAQIREVEANAGYPKTN